MDPAPALISVIIPAYNAEPFLARCLDSVLCQTLPDFELLLIDDGSTDGTGAIADRYAEKDDRVKVIHKENGGVSSARNRGLEVARGGFITFVDADDTVAPSYLEKLYGRLCETGADIAVSGILDDVSGYTLTIRQSHVYTQDQIRSDSIHLLSVCWAHMFRRSTMTVCRFAEDIRYSEDTLFTTQNFFGRPCNTLVTHEEFLYIYNRNNPQAATAQNFRIERLSEIEACRRMQEAVKDHPPVADMIRKRLLLYVWNNYRSILSTGANSRYPTETAELRREFLEDHKQILKLLPPRSRVLPWLCVRSERLGQWTIQKKDRLKSRKNT